MPITLKNALQNFYHLATDHHKAYWAIEFTWDDKQFVELFIATFETQLEFTCLDIESMQDCARTFLLDIINLKSTNPEHSNLLDFLQFYSSTLILDFLTSNKLFPYSFDWISNSLGDDIGTEKSREIHLGRLRTMNDFKHPFKDGHFFYCMSLWAKNLFYYSRVTGGHNELALQFTEECLDWFIWKVNRETDDVGISAIVQLSTWCFNNQHRDKCSRCDQLLSRIYHKSDNRRLKKLIAFHFSCMKDNYTDQTREQWSLEVKNLYSDMLQQHEPMQLMINLYENDINTLKGIFDEVLVTVRKYSQAHPIQTLGNIYHNNRIFSLFETLIVTLVSNGEVGMANRLFGAFFSISEERLLTDGNLYIVPNSEQGVLYAKQGASFFNQANSIQNIPVITGLENHFLGTRHALIGTLDFTFDLPERPGVADRNFADRFYVAIRDHFKPAELAQQFPLSDLSGYHYYHGTQAQIQSMIVAETGIAIPLIFSFEEPKSARELKRVFIWQGYTQMAEIERIGLRCIFEKYNIEVFWISCFESTKEVFLQQYADPAYDLIWILGHGEFAQDETHLSYLNLGNGIEISIEELKNMRVQSDMRRLLVLDTCDSATTGLANNPLAIGIGVTTINGSQSMIGHNWPVENISSLIHGLLLATFLSQGTSYLDAYRNTILTFKEGKETVLQHLANYCDIEDVVERIRNTEIEFENFFYWGSLSFMI